MDRVLVIGATGQLGRAAVNKIAARGIAVRALTRSPEGAADLQKLGVETIAGDLTDPPSLRRACEGITTVVTTANAAIPTRATDTFAAVERDGYRHLIQAAVEARVRRFVYTSVPHSRHEALSPLLTYKRQTEQALIASGLEHVIVRAGIFMDTAFTMMGSTIPLRGASSATVLRPWAFSARHLNRIKDSIEKKHVALIPGDGTLRQGFISVDNVADFLASAALSGPSGIHLASGPEALTYLDVVHIFERLLGFPLRVQRTPARVFRIAVTVLRPFSPAGSNLMALNYIAATEESPADAGSAAAFGVALTSAEKFLRAKISLAASAPTAS